MLEGREGSGEIGWPCKSVSSLFTRARKVREALPQGRERSGGPLEVPGGVG